MAPRPDADNTGTFPRLSDEPREPQCLSMQRRRCALRAMHHSCRDCARLPARLIAPGSRRRRRRASNPARRPAILKLPSALESRERSSLRSPLMPRAKAKTSSRSAAPTCSGGPPTMPFAVEARRWRRPYRRSRRGQLLAQQPITRPCTLRNAAPPARTGT